MVTTSTIKYALVVICFIFLTGCEEHAIHGRNYPSMDTKTVTKINEEGATFNGEILATGTDGISDHGFLYALSTTPSLGASERISLGPTNRRGQFTGKATVGLEKGKRYHVRAYAITASSNIIVYGETKQFESKGGAAPEISAITPQSGIIGDQILIIGTSFSSQNERNIVIFSSNPTFPLNGDNDTLRVVVPSTAILGENQVTVAIGATTSVNSAKFVLLPMSIETVPSTASKGQTIIIGGQNFPLKNFLSATLFGKSAQIVSSTRTQVQLVVPTDAVGPSSPVTLKAGVQQVTSSASITLQ
jgi:hypothetical protein